MPPPRSGFPSTRHSRTKTNVASIRAGITYDNATRRVFEQQLIPRQRRADPGGQIASKIGSARGQDLLPSRTSICILNTHWFPDPQSFHNTVRESVIAVTIPQITPSAVGCHVISAPPPHLPLRERPAWLRCRDSGPTRARSNHQTLSGLIHRGSHRRLGVTGLSRSPVRQEALGPSLDFN
jgi:hypothetical protein